MDISTKCHQEHGGYVFASVEDALGTFLPRLFFGKTKYLSPIVGSLSTMPVKKYGLLILNPVTTAKENYLSSQQVSAELIRAVTGVVKFYNAYHLLALR